MKKICVNNERINVLTSIILMALFNFLFLGTEYLFDKMMAYASRRRVKDKFMQFLEEI